MALSSGEVVEGRIFCREDLEALLVEPTVIPKDPKLVEVDQCQHVQMDVCGRISTDLAIGVEPLSNTDKDVIDNAHEVARLTFKSAEILCRVHCVAAALGKCTVGIADSVNSAQMAEVYAGADYETTVYIGTQSYTTPTLQTTASIFGRASLPKGNPVSNMPKKVIMHYADSISRTELGRQAGLPERVTLPIT